MARILTTNNRMELMAVIEALGSLKRRCQLCTYGLAVRAARGSRSGCQTGYGATGRCAAAPVKNADLWQRPGAAARPTSNGGGSRDAGPAATTRR